MKHKTTSAMKKKKVKKIKTKKSATNFYGLGRFNYLIFKFLCSRFKLRWICLHLHNNIMKKQENIIWDKSKLEDYTKQLKDLWYSKWQSKNKEYFKKTDGFIKLVVGFNKITWTNHLEKNSNRKN